ncbi:MAG TPA: class I SAM-dependent methyltransferase [Solirubrobacterales bacterium]|nr:class I SAM-dependent methyltransferase [Solirubrobacterales bacterium]
MSEQGDSHRRSVSRVYSGYGRSRRKQRAWAADNPGNAAIRGEVLDHLLRLAAAEIAGGGDILDAGCGNGWWLRALAEAGVQPERLYGIDIQPERVAGAREAVPEATIAVGDARKLRFPDESFAVVLQLTLLSSLGSHRAIRESLGEGMRVLAPGGLLLIYEPRVPNPLNRHTFLVKESDLTTAGVTPREELSLTVLPALARRLGRRTQDRYERLARLPFLRTHRLVAYRAPRKG